MNGKLPIRPTFAEINLDNLSHNIREFKQHIGNKLLMAVVKGDGYGHGSAEVAEVALSEGANYLGVAFMEEGIVLRKEGIAAPILILGHTPPEHMEACVRYGLTPTIISVEGAKALSQAAVKLEKTPCFHIKIDTGMGRIGIMPDEILSFVKRVLQFSGIKLEGVFTHFSVADAEDKEYTYDQFNKFQDAVTQLKNESIKIRLVHAANTAAAIDLDDTHLDMARVGLGIYGHYPSSHMQEICNLKPVMSLKSQISHVKLVPPNTSISYGRKFITDNESIVGTLPIGYADGFSRMLTGSAELLIRGKRAPIVGSICMDQCMFLSDSIPEACVGDEVVIFGAQGGDEITVEEIADKLGTLNYEILTMVDKRVPRIYIRGGKVIKTKSLTSNETFRRLN